MYLMLSLFFACATSEPKSKSGDTEESQEDIMNIRLPKNGAIYLFMTIFNVNFGSYS